MLVNRVEGDQYVAGNISCQTLTPPAGCITDAAIPAGAAIDASKLQHQHSAGYAQPNAAATTETKIVHRCYGATASVLAFYVGSIAVAIGAATVTFDLKKNGASILTGVVTLNSSNAARVAVAGTLSGTPTLVAGDVLEVVVVATAGGGTLPTGVFGFVTINEKPL